MKLSTFLTGVAQRYGADVLEGAMVFVMLDRHLDHAIANALSAGAFHHGTPSPWSHCFMLAEPFGGPSTRILEASIRLPDGAMIWDDNTNLQRTLEIVAGSTVGNGVGEIYDVPLHVGTTNDGYDDARVTARGIRWIPSLTPEQRRAVVAAGRGLRAENCKYDLPGLLRELPRLFAGAAIPGAPKRLFCSAFLASCYRTALGVEGDFAPGVASVDVTPDELWYSRVGVGVADTGTIIPPLPGGAAAALRGANLQSEPMSPAAAAAPMPAASVARVDRSALQVDLEKALDALERNRTYYRRDVALTTLKRALDQLKRAGTGTFEEADATTHPDDFLLSLAKSARAERAIAPSIAPSPRAALTGADIVLGGQYSDSDIPGWVKSFVERMFTTRASFRTPPAGEDLVRRIANDVTIALVADWGTGNASSIQLMGHIDTAKPNFAVHLGDVYYAGTPEEERDRFVNLWPVSLNGGSYALNSNHEMYSGGHGYFDVALQHAKFSAQRGFSVFALTNDHWLVLGVDSAYYAHDFLYQKGAVDAWQTSWLRRLATDARQHGKKIVLLSHHEGLDKNGNPIEPLWSSVAEALGGGPDYWYWGHDHCGVVLKPRPSGSVSVRGRCLGHGGIPYKPDPSTPAMVWSEQEAATYDTEMPQRGLNGFVMLTLSGATGSERFIDELGRERWTGQL